MKKLFDQVRCALRSSATVAAIALMLVASPLVVGVYSAENIGKVSQPLVGGSVISAFMQEELGLLTLNRGTGSCSATLLNNDWAITAAHCVETSPGSNMNVAAGAITLTANWKAVQAKQGIQVNSFRPLDVAIVRVATPFAVNGATTGYRRQALGLAPQNLQNYTIEIVGRGINQFASGSGATAMPSQSDGQYRVGNATIGPRFENNLNWYSFPTASVAGGDSGGASFATIQSGRVLTGVHALCNASYIEGKPKTGWTWVNATPECADAPVEPVWSRIQQIIAAAPPAAPPPSQFIGTFGKTPPSYRPLWVYGVASNGDLLWYRKDSSAANWQGARKVGNGWAGFKSVLPAGGNSLYGIAVDGTLKWYRHDGFNDGSFNWKGPIDVGNGWQNFLKVFSGGDGILYAIQSNGSLLWYRHNGFADGGGPQTWEAPKQVGNGWGQFRHVFAMGQGVIYAVQADGTLLWYRHRGYANGQSSWSGPQTVGSGWQGFTHVVALGEGIILAVKPDGSLLWYKHIDYESGRSPGASAKSPAGGAAVAKAVALSAHWEGPVAIGNGWQGFKTIIGLIPTTQSSGPR